MDFKRAEEWSSLKNENTIAKKFSFQIMEGDFLAFKKLAEKSA